MRKVFCEQVLEENSIDYKVHSGEMKGFTTLRSAGDADANGVPSLDIGRLSAKGHLESVPRVCGGFLKHIRKEIMR